MILIIVLTDSIFSIGQSSTKWHSKNRISW